MDSRVQEILPKYGFYKPTCEPITIGLIHDTYKIESKGKVYILQKLHALYNSNNPTNYDAVTKHLSEKGLEAQHVVPTIAGSISYQDGEDLWRVLTFIPGEIHETVQDVEMAFEAGHILGKTHKALQDMPDVLKQHRHAKRDLRKQYDDFVQTMKKNEISKEFQIWKNEIMEIPNLFFPDNIRRHVTHGDPKISNIVFEEGTNKARAMIDLDDVSRDFNAIIDLGDAFRSWCSKKEDDPENIFDLDLFTSALMGYAEGSKGLLDTEEKEFLPQTIKLITILLASRFLRDYYEDQYFGYDKERYSSRREHNLARTRGQMSLYHDIVDKLSEIKDIISKVS